MTHIFGPYCRTYAHFFMAVFLTQILPQNPALAEAENASVSAVDATEAEIVVEYLEMRVGKGETHGFFEAYTAISADRFGAMLKVASEIDRTIDPSGIETQLRLGYQVSDATFMWVGGRHDFETDADQAYAAAGLETKVGFLEVEATTFVSEYGDALARLESKFDMPLNSKLMLRPKIEVNIAFQDVAATGVEAGAFDMQASGRLYYQVNEIFSPYIGLVHSRLLGDTAQTTRALGEPVSDNQFVIGLSASF